MKKKILFGIVITTIFAFFLYTYFIKGLRLSEYARKECNFEKSSEYCELNLNGLVKKKIDGIFIFYPGISKNEISQALNLEYNNNKEITDERRRIVIIGEKHILFEEEFWNNELEFRGGNFIEFSREKRLANPYDYFKNPTFKVTYSKDDNFYLLELR